jgi:hypothetical protein
VARVDEERKTFNFRKVLMINPAVNLYRSVSKIEGLLDKIPGGPRKIGAFFNRMLDKFTEFYRRGDFIDVNEEFLYAVYKNPYKSGNSPVLRSGRGGGGGHANMQRPGRRQVPFVRCVRLCRLPRDRRQGSA